MWRWTSRSEEPATRKSAGGPRTPGSSGAEGAGGDFFVLHPAEGPAPRIDRPPPARSLARLALTVALITALLVAVAWLIGFIVKVQLDRYFTSGS